MTTRDFVCDRCGATTQTDGGWAIDWIGCSFPVFVPAVGHYELQHRVWCASCAAAITTFAETPPIA